MFWPALIPGIPPFPGERESLGSRLCLGSLARGMEGHVISDFCFLWLLELLLKKKLTGVGKGVDIKNPCDLMINLFVKKKMVTAVFWWQKEEFFTTWRSFSFIPCLSTNERENKQTALDCKLLLPLSPP